MLPVLIRILNCYNLHTFDHSKNANILHLHIPRTSTSTAPSAVIVTESFTCPDTVMDTVSGFG